MGKFVLQVDTRLDPFGHSRLQPTHLTLVLIIQAKFEECLTLSETYLTATIEQGSTENLPVVRMGTRMGCRYWAQLDGPDAARTYMQSTTIAYLIDYSSYFERKSLISRRAIWRLVDGVSTLHLAAYVSIDLHISRRFS